MSYENTHASGKAKFNDLLLVIVNHSKIPLSGTWRNTRGGPTDNFV
jgi:hypothetical protein